MRGVKLIPDEAIVDALQEPGTAGDVRARLWVNHKAVMGECGVDAIRHRLDALVRRGALRSWPGQRKQAATQTFPRRVMAVVMYGRTEAV